MPSAICSAVNRSAGPSSPSQRTPLRPGPGSTSPEDQLGVGNRLTLPDEAFFEDLKDTQLRYVVPPPDSLPADFARESAKLSNRPSVEPSGWSIVWTEPFSGANNARGADNTMILRWGAMGFLLSGWLVAADPNWSQQDLEFFERQVRPVLATHCSSCHSEANAMSGLRLDSREAVLAGGTRGPAASPNQPDGSLLIQAVRHESLKMPLGGRLSDTDVASLQEWVRRGLPWPTEQASDQASAVSQGYAAMRREHWAFQPVADPPVPAVESEHPIDRFVLHALRQAGLTANSPAGPSTLIRRLSFVLTGLPPVPSDVMDFIADPSPSAYEEAVDRLLDSPHFGERWARHWMDIVRFGETLGNDWNYENNGAWLYRDYLIRAFNADVPYDQLVREHIAGDLLDRPRLDPKGEVNESMIGTFFYRLGEQGHDDCTMFREVRTDVVDDQIDTLGKAFQGLTIACARCHDHKLDPIPTADYYGLYGVLDSSRMVTRTVDTHALDAGLKSQMRDLKAVIRTGLANAWLVDTEALAGHLLASLGEIGLGERPSDAGSALDPERGEHIQGLIQKGELGIEDPLVAWVELARRPQQGSGDSLEAVWDDLVTRYENRRRWNAAFNRDSFDLIADFGTGEMYGWHAEGRAFEPAIAASGEFAISPNGPGVVSGIFPAGVYTHLDSEKLNGAIRSPYLPRDSKYLSIQVLGGKLAAWRTVLDNCMLSERYAVIDKDTLGWIKIPLRDEHDEFRIYAELVTKHDNPRIPDRPDRLKGVTEEQIAEPRSFFGVTKAVLHDCDEAPRDELTHMRRLFAPGPPADIASLAARYAEISERAVRAWSAGTATDDDVRWLGLLLESGLIANSKYLTPLLRESVDAYRALERRLGVPRVVQGMADLDPGHDAPILKSGDASDLGETVPRGFLSLLEDSEPGGRPHGSGRREVAEMIASPRNPLTARVMVNRIWHHLFGRGLVPTTDNLGRFGERPARPELLDHLASQFIEDGWSIKKTIRRIVLSETFRQASDNRPEALEADPGNDLSHRYPARRLEAESIRDSILAVSGKLDRALYGPSIHPYREKPKPYRKLLSGPLDGWGRRSIYLKVTRHEGAALLEALDFPAPAMARGKRDVTNVPRQALTMMNDRFVVNEAHHWAKALVEKPDETVLSRLRSMYLAALGRLPTEREADKMKALVWEFADLHNEPLDDVLVAEPVWADVAHTIFNLKEFIYIR